jgi:glycosyltransferase involved in cell wall biosynthesis
MKILFTITGPWGTGSFTAVAALADELKILGHQVKIFFPDDNVESNDRTKYYNDETYEIWRFPIEKNNIKINTFPLIIPDPNPRSATNHTFKDLTQQQFQLYLDTFTAKIKKVILDFKPDIIECEHVWLMGYVIHKLKHQYFAAAHTSDQLGFDFDKKMQKYAIQAAHNAKYIFASSEFMRKNVVELYGADEKKVIFIPHGYNHSTFQPRQVDRKVFLKKFNLTIPDNSPIVVFPGKLSHTKGIDTLLEANRLLEHTNIHFLIFGSGTLDQVINVDDKKYSLARVHFLNHQPPEILAQAHNIATLGVIPSRIEGFSIACLEAMGCGLPMVVTRTGGPDSFAVGRIIDIENPRQLADAILEIINLPASDYKKLSQKALNKAKSYSWKTITQERLKYFQAKTDLT